jgi:putative PIG3 family NAD(P)H quinone oxidoreductase
VDLRVGRPYAAARMRAVIVRAPGDESVLAVAERPVPEVGPGHVRVRVAFAGVNRADLLQRAGRYPAPPGVPADIPGLEYAGTVDGVGAGVTSLAPGDRVCGLVAGGAYAEYVVVHEREVARIPEGVAELDAAAIPEAFVTALDALEVRAQVAPAERILVHAVGSGVGTAALQLGKALGCHVTGTSRTSDKLERARELGLDIGLVAPSPEKLGPLLVEEAHRTGRGFDVVVDLVGGPYVAATLPAVAERGRVVVVGLTAGAKTELDLGLLLRRRLTLEGTVLRSRPLEEKIAAASLLRRTILPWLAEGRIRPVIESVLPLEQAGDAHRLLASNATFGKVILDLREPLS